MLSAAGSSMSFISSFTETSGLRSPHSSPGRVGTSAVAADAVPEDVGWELEVEGGGDEHAAATSPETSTPQRPYRGLHLRAVGIWPYRILSSDMVDFSQNQLSTLL